LARFLPEKYWKDLVRFSLEHGKVQIMNEQEELYVEYSEDDDIWYVFEGDVAVGSWCDEEAARDHLRRLEANRCWAL
jgi:hypothetical protein